MKDFLIDLRDAMIRHDISFIYWACHDSSDTYGIYESQIEIENKNGETLALEEDCIDVRTIDILIDKISTD